jgi:hypothetical protein
MEPMMHPPSQGTSQTPPKRLLQATAGAAAAALVVLLVAVFPAEYGIDPTGIGHAFGFTRLHEDGEGPTVNDTGPKLLFSREVRWVLEEETVHNQSGFLSVSDTQTIVRFSYNGTNLTRMAATLSWTDETGTEPDEFEIQIRAPDGRASEYVSGTNPIGAPGRISTELQWRSVPDVAEANGSVSFPAAPDRSAQGAWAVVVRIYWAGGPEQRPGNGWSLHVVAQQFRFERDVALGDANAALDSVTLTLPPGRAVEYKFGMAKDAFLNYTWTATAPLTYDFHGDTAATVDEPISYQQGVAASGDGSFQAPFAGRHGWWWYNAGTTAVTLTLQTSGEYTILGVV